MPPLRGLGSWPRFLSAYALGSREDDVSPGRGRKQMSAKKRLPRGSGDQNLTSKRLRCPYRFNKSIGSFTSCTRKYFASAGYFRATASYIAYATLRYDICPAGPVRNSEM